MKMTKTTLSKLTREQLLDLSARIEEIHTELRGYSGGLTRKMMEIFDNETLISLALKSKRNFKSMGLNLEELV